MNAPSKSAARIRPEEYLALEEKAHFKHEYLDGVIYSWQGDVPESMAGGTRMHNRIVQNILAALRPHLRGTGCRTYATDNISMTLDELYEDVNVGTVIDG